MQHEKSTAFTKEILSSVLKEQREVFLAKDFGVQRELLNDLGGAMKSSQIIVVTGLRRVGKSTLLAQAAHAYLDDDFYFVNFEDERLLRFHVGDFDFLYETLLSLFGEKKTFLFDEIQNVPEWERFVRRLHDQGYKFIITGSNASLLSRELGTRLTGRTVRIEVFPFSFREYLNFRKSEIPTLDVVTTKQKGMLLKHVDEYLALGGIPDALKYPDLDIHKSLYHDVLYRDIATRYQIDNIRRLKELAFFLISNTGSSVSFNKLKESLTLGSVNTVKSYIEYFENSWLFFVVNKYAFSVKEQQIAAKKIYSIDTGLARSVGFSFSENKGRFLENLLFLHLRKKHSDIYYYKTKQDHEVDFFLPKIGIFIQVVQSIHDETTKKRELRALVEAASEYKKKAKLFVVTQRDKETLIHDGYEISVVPMYEWLLQ